jgi:hypothetical protein
MAPLVFDRLISSEVRQRLDYWRDEIKQAISSLSASTDRRFLRVDSSPKKLDHGL